MTPLPFQPHAILYAVYNRWGSFVITPRKEEVADLLGGSGEYEYVIEYGATSQIAMENVTKIGDRIPLRPEDLR